MHGSRSGRWSRSRPSAKRHSIVALFTLLSVLALAGSAHAADPTIAAVGDLGCATTDPSYNGGDGTATHCRQRYVSDLLVDQGLVGFLGLGDNQYVNGELANFQAVYDGTFGRVNPIAYPSLGNAEYYTPGAKGYFDYFASAGVTTRIGASSLDASRFASSNYYSYEIGGWHLIALNSNCAQVGGCGVGSPQEAWLKRNLALYPNRCTLAYWHHPRWNSGRLGNDSSTAALWTALYNARADIVLNGHGNHHYERHAPMDASGAPDAANGIREFIVSTGGEAHGVPPTTAGKTDTLQVADYTSFGILKLGLHARSYDWQFVPEVGGSFTDSGSGTCHAGPAQRPAAPTLAAEPGDGRVQLSWSAGSDGGASVSGYRVYRGTAAGAETLLASVGGAATSYVDSSVTSGTAYFYRVAAVNSVGEGDLSNTVSATPTASVPPPAFPATGVLATADPVAATFPGVNGPILFREDNLRTGLSKPLFRAMPDGTGITELDSRPGFASDWRADGTRVAFDFVKPNGAVQIATMAPDGSGVEVLTSGRGIHEIPSWSPSGGRIVYDFSPSSDFNSPNFETHLWTMRADGSGKRRLPMRSPGFDVEPRYSPAGGKVAFGRIRFDQSGDFHQAVFVVNTRTQRVRQVTPWRLDSEHPTWSPDGQWVLYNSPNGTVEMVRPSGEDRQTIAPATKGFGGHKPRFSPDGTQILLMCENQGTRKRPPEDYNQDICAMGADGSNIVHVINTPDRHENWPSWGPSTPDQ